MPRVIVSKATKTLVIPRIGPTINAFPDAHSLTHLDQDYLAVPHDVRSVMVLENLGMKVPGPMDAYYDYVGGSPFGVQRATCALLTTHTRAYVLNDMGTGKTRAALWSWDYLNKNGFAGKMLVVGPLSTLNFVWGRETFGTLPHRKVAVLHGTKKKRLEALASDADIYVINHDGIGVIFNELMARSDIDVLCIDELAVYRNNTDRSKTMRKLAKRFNWVWGMTGRPMPNEPTDVWGEAQIVTPHTVPKHRTHCRDMLMTRINQYVYVPKPDAVEQAYKMLQPAVRFKIEDVTELPEVIHTHLDVDMSPDQKKAYTTLAREFSAMVHNKQITAANAGVAMNKLLQVAIGYVYTGASNGFGTVELDSTPRKQALLDVIASTQRKVIVFVPFRHAMDGLSKLLEDNGIEHAVVHGDTTNRDEIFNLFQNTPKYPVILAHPQVAAHGLTLTAADTIVWYCPIASLELYDQANARISRVGQKFKQQVVHLQATPVERKVYRLLANKQKLQDQLLSLFEEASELLEAA